jgi:hypothetical protein
MRADATAVRIEQLIAEHLVRVADRVDGWTTLFQDPTDDRFWETLLPSGRTARRRAAAVGGRVRR